MSDTGKDKITGKTVKSLTPEEREEKIGYYASLMQLTLRAFDPEEEIENQNEATEQTEEQEFFDADVHYDEVDCLASFDETDMKYFYDKLAPLNALDVYYRIGLDYCVNQLAFLKKSISRYVSADVDRISNTDNKKKGKPDKKKHLVKMFEMQIARIEANYNTQQKYEEQIAAIKKKLFELGCEFADENQATQDQSVKKKRSKVIVNSKQNAIKHNSKNNDKVESKIVK